MATPLILYIILLLMQSPYSFDTFLMGSNLKLYMNR